MELSQAKHIADSVVFKLKPFCERIMICGSIRRKKQDVKDVDLVVIPKEVPQKNLFGMINYERDPGFMQSVNEFEKLKGDPTGKYTQRLFQDVKIEISIATPDNFGNLVLIRTGNAEFSHLVMKIALKRGFNQVGGYLYKNSRLIPIREEEDYFKTLGIDYIQPENRNVDAYK